MAINSNACGIAIVAGAAAILVAYLGHLQVERPMSNQYQKPTIVGLDAALDACTESEFFRAHHLTENQKLGFTPHRYPNVSGGNVSTVIHYGFSQLRLPAPQDSKWITRPPAEVMF